MGMTTSDSNENQGLEGGGHQVATFAGGCFWCMEPPFDSKEGVVSVTSGYMGGTVENPSYEQISQGNTGHYEVIQVHYDPEKVSYWELVQLFFKQIDPTDAGGQFADRGSQYRTAIFYHDKIQERVAIEVIQSIQSQFSEPIVTALKSADVFYPAEEYHQSYYQKNPSHYKRYRFGSGRDRYLKGRN